MWMRSRCPVHWKAEENCKNEREHLVFKEAGCFFVAFVDKIGMKAGTFAEKLREFWKKVDKEAGK